MIYNQFILVLKVFIFLIYLLISVKINGQKKIKKKIINEPLDYDDIYFTEVYNEISDIYLLNEIENKKHRDFEDLMRYNNLSDLPKDPNDPLIEKERKTILEHFYGDINKKDIIIYFDYEFPFGNQIAAFNKLIFYCEIIRCKKILLSEDNKMYIKNPIYDKDYNISIEIFNPFQFEVNNESGERKELRYDYLTGCSPEFFYDFYNLKIENRLDIIKDEIVRNLPELNISKNDLIMHFRSSDIFQHQNNPVHAPDYAQPPLCFYERILLKKSKFEKIYIISVDDIYNPVIKELRKKYPEIIYNENPLEVDISYLVKGYNIVGSISSFLISSIKLNDNLKYFWEYDRYPMCSKMFHSHHSIFNIKRKFTLFKMEPSKTYKNKMIVWKDTDEQLKIMLEDTCPHGFKKIPPNISEL